ncbi:peptidoglycan bridge formation glycyltransferase FemA/FemB family protein [Planococcus donghaensis]|uniref:peptidoglycan bridge formation glycyltransferase FemA/FemB family protein n=1 Tax=Planococcus donghaensis TaxID=414778 RepID=UPI0037360BD8
MRDLFFEIEYGQLYEKIENGTCEVFEFSHPFGKVYHQFIKKEIPIKLDDGPYFDLVTPYGYGGPLMTDVAEGKNEELAMLFQEAFQGYCQENRIVSESVRFHPVFENAADFRSCYEIVHRRNTTGTNLEAFEDPVQSEFSKSSRRNVRKALKSGVSFSITINPPDLKDFKAIYYSTMDRNKAANIYYFDDDYFSDCLCRFGENIILTEVVYEEKIIGMGLSFFYNDLIHTHLSGTLKEYHHLSPAYVLQYALAVWGKDNGMALIHDGGGRTRDPEDSLFLFKKQFGKNTEFAYYFGFKIWNSPIYDALCEKAGVSNNTEAFPAYRQKSLEKVST